MEPEKNEERKYFENILESFKGLAAPAGNHYVKGLNMDRLTDKKKSELIDTHINMITADMKAIGRMEYCTLDADQLWERVKSQGLLTNAEEMKNLQDMMVLSEIFRCLTIKKLEFDNRLEAARKKGKKDSLMLQGGIAAHELSEVIRDIDKDYPLVAAPSTTNDFIRAAISHDWSSPKESILLACMTTVLKKVVDCVKRFNPDFNYANIERCGLFISKYGNPISAHDLSSSISKNRNLMLRIESYFARLRKKH